MGYLGWLLGFFPFHLFFFPFFSGAPWLLFQVIPFFLIDDGSSSSSSINKEMLKVMCR